MANNPPFQGTNAMGISGSTVTDYQKAASDTFNSLWGGLASMGSVVSQKASETN